MLLPIHVAAGGLAIVLGAAALLSKKGGPVHRRVGLLFVGAMLVMGISASILAFRNSSSDPNVTGGFLTAYFVGTALVAVRPVSGWTRGLNLALLPIPIGLAVSGIVQGAKALNSAHGSFNGVPFQMHFFMATVLLVAAAGDIRVLRSGALHGGPRLARHLWRMCYALFIAAGSFFSIRERVAKVLPEPFTTVPMRTLPILLVFGAMMYWLWRVRGGSRGAMPSAAHQRESDVAAQPTVSERNPQ
jgi:hypothetical protein